VIESVFENRLGAGLV